MSAQITDPYDRIALTVKYIETLIWVARGRSYPDPIFDRIEGLFDEVPDVCWLS